MKGEERTDTIPVVIKRASKDLDNGSTEKSSSSLLPPPFFRK
jgi:hypothetical protein